MLRKDYEEILPLINRAIDTITDNERLAINQKWTRVYAPSTMPVIYFYALVGVTLLMLFLLYVRTRRLKHEMGNKEIDMKHLEEMARIDSLTKINNRRMLDTVLAQHLAIAERYRQLLSVVFFDIDSFKAINDHYGHNVGDDVLVELTNLVLDSIRGSDVFGRWGGDEFLLILPESSQKQANRLATSLHQKILEHSFSGVPRVSCSFGVEAYQYGDTIKTLMARADDALYKAKGYKDTSPFT
jgi:polar amino acid transport system substrate-binding protein